MNFNSSRLDHQLINIVNNSLYDLPSPSNLSYWWNYGSLLGVFLAIQLISGIFLSMHYAANIDIAFESVTNISREVNSGWFIRFAHVGGSSSYFLFLYLHVARGLSNFSFTTNPLTWNIGVVIMLASMAAAFLGYVLPWGQMSYWGATVISNFFSVIPYIGLDFVGWLWGGFSVNNPTLIRFFSLHFVIPFLILFLVVLHFLFLHENGSSNPGNLNKVEKSSFFPYFLYKDLIGFILGVYFSYILMFYNPSVVLEEQNFLNANFLVTPEHIQPEWYFLAAYAVLRAVPNKLGGVISLVCFMLFFIFLPFISSTTNNLAKNKFEYLTILYLWAGNVIFLTWLGGQPVEDPYVFLSQVGFVVYFSYFFIVYLFS